MSFKIQNLDSRLINFVLVRDPPYGCITPGNINSTTALFMIAFGD